MREYLKNRRKREVEGIKRLADMVEGQKDKYLNIIVEHLMLQTDMNEAFLDEEKNLKDMATYIRNKAKKQAKEDVAIIEYSIVFKWAREYFAKSNKELRIKKHRLDKGKHGDVAKVEIKEDDEFGSIFGESLEETTAEKKEEIEQISIFAA